MNEPVAAPDAMLASSRFPASADPSPACGRRVFAVYNISPLESRRVSCDRVWKDFHGFVCFQSNLQVFNFSNFFDFPGFRGSENAEFSGIPKTAKSLSLRGALDHFFVCKKCFFQNFQNAQFEGWFGQFQRSPAKLSGQNFSSLKFKQC